MASKVDRERRNRLVYLALYYAIQGNEERSEQIRRMVRQMDPRSKSKRAAAIEEPVVVYPDPRSDKLDAGDEACTPQVVCVLQVICFPRTVSAILRT